MILIMDGAVVMGVAVVLLILVLGFKEGGIEDGLIEVSDDENGDIIGDNKEGINGLLIVVVGTTEDDTIVVGVIVMGVDVS
jgi:hypothetical protein